jgi:hypothetical protein
MHWIQKWCYSEINGLKDSREWGWRMSTRLQQVMVVLLLGSALVLLAGCGNKSGSSGGGEAAPKVTVAMDSLPTMPAAHFGEPTSMITPEGAQVEATATVEVSNTTAVSTTTAVTETGAVSGTK